MPLEDPWCLRWAPSWYHVLPAFSNQTASLPACVGYMSTPSVFPMCLWFQGSVTPIPRQMTCQNCQFQDSSSSSAAWWCGIKFGKIWTGWSGSDSYWDSNSGPDLWLCLKVFIAGCQGKLWLLQNCKGVAAMRPKSEHLLLLGRKPVALLSLIS